jgi:hypothetical protein
MSLRAAVDRVTRTADRVQRGARPMAKATRMLARGVRDAATAQAKMWRANMEKLKAEPKTAKPPAPASRARKSRR